MPERNAAVAAIFDEIADILEIQGANPFRVIAYRNGSAAIRDLGTELDVLIGQGTQLTDIPGIGEDLSKKIREILDTSRSEYLERLHQDFPKGVTELLKIPGLGPRRVSMLYHQLHIHDLTALEAAAHEGRLRALPGFGAKTEQKILAAVQARLAKQQG